VPVRYACSHREKYRLMTTQMMAVRVATTVKIKRVVIPLHPAVLEKAGQTSHHVRIRRVCQATEASPGRRCRPAAEKATVFEHQISRRDCEQAGIVLFPNERHRGDERHTAGESRQQSSWIHRRRGKEGADAEERVGLAFWMSCFARSLTEFHTGFRVMPIIGMNDRGW